MVFKCGLVKARSGLKNLAHSWWPGPWMQVSAAILVSGCYQPMPLLISVSMSWSSVVPGSGLSPCPQWSPALGSAHVPGGPWPWWSLFPLVSPGLWAAGPGIAPHRWLAEMCWRWDLLCCSKHCHQHRPDAFPGRHPMCSSGSTLAPLPNAWAF